MNVKKARITTPSNPVKKKALIGGPYAVDKATLKKAEEAIIAMVPQYMNWVERDLENLEAAYNQLLGTKGDMQNVSKQIYLISHDMKGQGGTFGFDLITAIGDQLCRMIDKMKFVREDEMEAIGIHINAMKHVINNKICGNGGKEGAKLLAGLKKVSDKFPK